MINTLDILFVCTGNTCRSPLAEVLLRNLLSRQNREVCVGSAGLWATPGSPASAGSRSVTQGDEDLSTHGARQVDSILVAKADLILTMTTAHRKALVDQYPDLAGKIHTLGNYAYGVDRDIPDPFGGDLNAYQTARTQIEAAVEIVARKIMEAK